MSAYDRRILARAKVATFDRDEIAPDIQKHIREGVWPLSLNDPKICILLMILDGLVLVAGSLASWFIYHQLASAQLSNWRFYVASSLIFSIIFVANGLRSRVYGFIWGVEKSEGMVKTCRGFVQTFLMFVALLFFLHWADAYSRMTLVIQFFLCGTLILSLRSFQFRLLEQPSLQHQLVTNRVVLVGSAVEIESVEVLWRSSRESLDIVKTFPIWLGPGGNVSSSDQINAFADRILRESRDLNPDRVVILLPFHERKRIDLFVERLSELPASIMVSTESLVAMRGKPSALMFGGLRMLRVVRKPLSATDRIIKRAFDIMTSSFLLLALLPVLAATAVLIKLDSAGPVFFIQRRKGFNQQQFAMLKFRSMYVQADGKAFAQTQKGDVRITRLGRWLRRWNIDELPQLINVLRGDMSLVGPRPHAVEHDDLYYSEIAAYARRHNMKPGITGLAQASGFRGATQTLEQMENRVSRDLEYIENWSLLFDLKILLMTVFSPHAYRNAF
jgi:Undecaprenyl-phosphate glucose phosphotransferase